MFLRALGSSSTRGAPNDKTTTARQVRVDALWPHASCHARFCFGLLTAAMSAGRGVQGGLEGCGCGVPAPAPFPPRSTMCSAARSMAPELPTYP